MTILIVTCCSPKQLQIVPRNYIILLIFTLCEGYIVSVICAMSNPRLVFMAALMTLAMTVALTLYAFTTKTDFTVCGGMFFIIGAAFFMFSLFAMFTKNNLLHIILSALGCILYGIYIIYDTQLIMGGKSQEISYDDYILGALLLYTDIIGLFLQLLELLQRLNKEWINTKYYLHHYIHTLSIHILYSKINHIIIKFGVLSLF